MEKPQNDELLLTSDPPRVSNNSRSFRDAPGSR